MIFSNMVPRTVVLFNSTAVTNPVMVHLPTMFEFPDLAFLDGFFF
jgi:hypothetical protein